MDEASGNVGIIPFFWGGVFVNQYCYLAYDEGPHPSMSSEFPLPIFCIYQRNIN